MGGGEVSGGWRVVGELWLSLGFAGRSRRSDVFEFTDTELRGESLRLSASWHVPLRPWLQVFGRVGPSVWWYDVQFTPPTGERLEASDRTFGGHAGLGVDFLPVNPALTGRFLRNLSLGVSVEATYDYVLPPELSDGGTDFGELDPSGPGFLLGLVATY